MIGHAHQSTRRFFHLYTQISLPFLDSRRTMNFADAATTHSAVEGHASQGTEREDQAGGDAGRTSLAMA